MQSDIHDIYGSWENPNVKSFRQAPDTRLTKNMLIVSIEYTPELHIMHGLFNVCSNHTMFKLQWRRI